MEKAAEYFQKAADLGFTLAEVSVCSGVIFSFEVTWLSNIYGFSSNQEKIILEKIIFYHINGFLYFIGRFYAHSDPDYTTGTFWLTTM